MDALVQFIRNALCCVKDLNLFTETAPQLWDANVTAQYYAFPAPLHKTTPLEVIISVTQLYAFQSATRSGWNVMTSSYQKLARIHRLVELRKQLDAPTAADRFMNASLVAAATFALRSMFIGLLVLSIGLSFFWLAANSWHVTETDWIGGLPGLIHALTVMEICLVPLLYYMYKDGTEQLAKAARMQQLVDKIQSNNNNSNKEKTTSIAEQDLDVKALTVMTGWVPFWEDASAISSSADTAEPSDEKLLAQEKQKVQDYLKDILGDKDEKQAKLLQQDKTAELVESIRVARLEGIREFVYLILNFIAFYGYLLGILSYYWPDDDKQPESIRRLKLGWNSQDADWHGNFAGDLMWTIEPIIILTSPALIRAMQPRTKKVKTE